jgi:pyruvate dehydrogenase E2 component (dihydrolipoamide acetyltransferase)
VPAPAPAGPDERGPVFASPSVRQFAREIGVDIHRVQGTGPGGRIAVEDVKTYARTHHRVGAAPLAVPEAPATEFSKWGAVRVEPMSNVRRATAQFMAQCWASVPHVTVFDTIDVTALEAARQRLKPQADRAGTKLTVTPLLLKLVAAALRQFPRLNASLDMVDERVIYKEHYHLGVAADTDRGLVVPVVRDVDTKGVVAIAKELADLADAARRGKLPPDAMQGATFTLTNLGGFGTQFFTPIVPTPQVGILGVGRATQQPVWDEAHGAFVPRLMLPVSLSFDHRLVDGADGARFVQWLKRACEEPLLVLLEG